MSHQLLKVILNAPFWQTAYEWNSVDFSICNAPTINQFKNRYRAEFFNRKNRLYEIFHSRAAVQHARIRMGLSCLNYHRKNYRLKLGTFIDDDRCPNCHNSPEDPLHFFIPCPYFATQRDILLRDISDIFLLHFPHLNIRSSTRHIQTEIVTIFLFGSDHFTFEENFTLFRAINDFIFQTKRFYLCCPYHCYMYSMR